MPTHKRTQIDQDTSKEPNAALPSVDVPRSPAVEIAKLMAPPVTKDACLACKSVFNYPIARWDKMPLSVLGLPRTEQEALHTRRLVMDVRQCANCSHIFHTEFDYDHIPYQAGSNMTYNEGSCWKSYQDEVAAEWAADYDLRNKTIIEIGCAEGLWLERMAKFGNRCIGFEPGPDAERARSRGAEVFAEYFQGSRLFEIKPDAIICRHVLEHLAAPSDMLEDIAMACAEIEIQPLFFAEVPLIEKAMDQNRVNDFQYEHVSCFTRKSLRVMFERSGFEVIDLRGRFGDEVVTIVARPRLNPRQKAERLGAATFNHSVRHQIDNVQATLRMWKSQGLTYALWGGTGRGAAFMNMFGITPSLAPIVIDSDPRKEGGFVPGIGQQIQAPEYLQQHPVDRILICTNWRARDIENEVRQVHGLQTELLVYLNETIQTLTADLKL